MKLLSIVVPCYNEGNCVVEFHEAIIRLGLSISVEFVFVDDGSSDGTLGEIKRLAASADNVRYISFSRNFGKEAALLAGLEHARGDVVVTMDADLQHKPELLPEMLRLVDEEHYDCVATRRTDREGESPVRSWMAHRFYGLISRYSEVSFPDGAMDFRMMTRQVVESVLKLRETNRFTKGIYQWVGFRTKWLETENAVRVEGESKWSMWGLFCYAMKGIVSFSTAPLQIASVFGAFCCVPAFMYLMYILAKWAVFGERVSGWPTLICVILFIGGLQLLAGGILGTYISFVYREVKRRPIYIVRESNCENGGC